MHIYNDASVLKALYCSLERQQTNNVHSPIESLSDSLDPTTSTSLLSDWTNVLLGPTLNQ